MTAVFDENPAVIDRRYKPRAGLSTTTCPPKAFRRAKLKDQRMKTLRLLALTSLSVLLAAPGSATTIASRFSTDPLLNGWQSSGGTNLFRWNQANENLAVTWDSSQTNSYFYHLLDRAYGKNDDFLIMFDLRLNDITVGTTPGKALTFEIALGLINTTNATGAGFIRGAGTAPNLVEFTYFPDDTNQFGATVSTLLISSENNFSSGGFTVPLELATNTLYHVVMLYTATNRTLHTAMTANGVPFGLVQDAYLGSSFDDFQVNAISINSYSDAGQFPGYGGSVLAHGTVDDFAFASPPPVTSIEAVAPGTIQFAATTNWLYTLQRTTDFQSWTNVLTTTADSTSELIMQDTNAPAVNASYRVIANLP